MATIEITPAVLFSGITTLSSMLVATWALSRRSRNWDEAEHLQKAVEGDPRSANPREREGLLRRVEDLEETVDTATDALTELKTIVHGDPESENARIASGILRRIENNESVLSSTVEKIRWIRRAMNAHGSDEHAFVASVEKNMQNKVEALTQENLLRIRAKEARKNLVREQDKNFDRGDEPISSDDLPPVIPTGRASTGGRPPIPREEVGDADRTGSRKPPRVR